MNVQSIKGLVEPDRVHRAVYTDAALFELELDRLFGRAWLMLGHESQVSVPPARFTSSAVRRAGAASAAAPRPPRVAAAARTPLHFRNWERDR